jgi:hypothetical protein
LPTPQFFLARDQGKSPPRLHKARVEVARINARHDMDTLSSLQTQAAPSEAVGPMKPLQGPTLIAGGSQKERASRGQDHQFAQIRGRSSFLHPLLLDSIKKHR